MLTIRRDYFVENDLKQLVFASKILFQERVAR